MNNVFDYLVFLIAITFAEHPFLVATFFIVVGITIGYLLSK